jgi:hypothetical protein
MLQGIRNAAALVRPGGLLAYALYRESRLCWAWKIEKRWYSQASERSQRAAAAIYVGLYRLALAVTGRGFAEYRKTYASGRRGMDFYRNVHDWLGGYPYESISPAAMGAVAAELGLSWCGQTRGRSRSGRSAQVAMSTYWPGQRAAPLEPCRFPTWEQEADSVVSARAYGGTQESGSRRCSGRCETGGWLARIRARALTAWML